MEDVQSEEMPDGSVVSAEVKDGSGTDGASAGEASPGEPNGSGASAGKLSAGGASAGSASSTTPRNRRPGGSSGGQSRFGHRRSPTTGHRVRRHKTPEPNFVPLQQNSEDKQKRKDNVKRSLSSPGEGGQRRISSSEEEEERKPRRISKPKSNESTKTKLEASKRWSGMTLTPAEVSNEVIYKNIPPKPALRKRSKSRGRDDNEDKQEGEKSAWWKSWPSWTQRIRGKSLEREPGGEAPVMVPPRRNRSLERPPVIKEKERRAAAKRDDPPVAKKRSKSKTRTMSEEERRPSVEESSDEFWKSNDGLRKRNIEEKKTEELIENPEITAMEELSISIDDDSQKQLVLVETSLNFKEDLSETVEIKEVSKSVKEKFSLVEAYKEIRSEWKTFVETNSREMRKIKILINHCIACFVILVMYCGTGAFVFRFTEGAFESFYKCGVKRVKRDFVDGLWMSSHNLREDEWKSLARRKLMEFEEQLHTAYEAGMTSYSGLKAWSFLNSFIYCLTVVTTIGYGHISPSTTTGRAITIIYAIFGIPMFLILLADFGKLFTRGIKFIWAFVRRVYYTGSCKKVRRTVPVQEMMKGVQMVYDIATFRRPSQLPPGVTLDEAAPPPLPPRAYTPGEPPGTPALSTFAIDDEFNLPISVAIFILLIYIICGATVFYIWESWGFFESFYFVFISMSTIGFGDFVPQNQMYMMASIVYLVFGLALTSMCINVVQEKLSDSFRQASAKIGATIGLRVAEEDGAVTPVAPAPVELPRVHGGFRATGSPNTPPTTSAALS